MREHILKHVPFVVACCAVLIALICFAPAANAATTAITLTSSSQDVLIGSTFHYLDAKEFGVEFTQMFIEQGLSVEDAICEMDYLGLSEIADHAVIAGNGMLRYAI